MADNTIQRAIGDGLRSRHGRHRRAWLRTAEQDARLVHVLTRYNRCGLFWYARREQGVWEKVMQLSKNFTLAELCKSQTAIRQGIDNMADADSIFHLRNLCEHVLQPVRNNFGPVIVNSGFRSKALNDIIGGSSRSQHCKGQAADIECPAVSNYELAQWIEENCDFDQLILEGYTPGSPRSGWVHVSFAGKNRWEVLTASFQGGRAQYRHGLVP